MNKDLTSENPETGVCKSLERMCKEAGIELSVKRREPDLKDFLR